MIFDIDISGHHLEYIIHIFKYLEIQEKFITDNYIFVVNPLFLDEVQKHFQSEIINKLNIIPIQNKELHKIENTRKVKTTFFQSIYAAFLVRKYALKLNIDECIILDIDLLYKGLILHKFFKIKINGIWFHPNIRIPNNNLKNIILKFLKSFFLKIILISNNIQTIFILNDKSSCIELNKITRSSIFTYLPDPINTTTINNKSEDSIPILIDKNKTIFLLFGAISERKGVLLILDAIQNHISIKDLERIQLLIIGKIGDDIKDQFYEKTKTINETKRFYPIIIDKFIEYSQISNIFSNSDYILMPYINFYGSSGILNYAVYFNKPIITGKDGLIAEIVKENKLGLITTLNSESLGKLMYNLSNKTSKNDYIEYSKNYIVSHSPEVFVRTLLKINH